MLRQIILILSIFIFILVSFVFSQTKNYLITELKSDIKKLDNIHQSSNYLAKSNNSYINDIKSNIIQIKKKLRAFTNNIDNPIYFDNNIILDQNVDLLDFYVYNFTTNSYQVFARLKNKQKKYLDWVKLRYNFYSNKTFIGTDYTYIDFETYGYSGISPYKYSFINTFIDKANFDSIAYQVQYDIKSGDDDIMWDQILDLQSVVIQPSGSINKWQGVVNNKYNYSMNFPNIYALIFKDKRMIALDYTYLDVQNDSLPPNSNGIFDSYIDLPSSYDEIQYYLNYSLYSLKGKGNIPPNIPIFSNINYNGFTRSNTALEVFIIDPNSDRCDLLVDYGDGVVPNWETNYTSGNNARIQHLYEFDSLFIAKAKVKDINNLETKWSEPVYANISLSTVPQIIHLNLNYAYYKKNYSIQLQASSGIEPYLWKVAKGLLPNGLILNSNTGQITGLPKTSGLFNFTITLTDAGSPSISDTSSFSITVINNKPVITSDDTLIANTNSEITYNASANDPDGNSITFDFLNYPIWLSTINSKLHGITPNIPSETSFILIATDGELSDTLRVTLIVKEQTSVNIHNIICDSYELYPNYPNPFNPKTMIKVSVPKSSDALISIYDINGKIIETIYKGYLNAGFHVFVWQANEISSGTYFIKFKTTDFSHINKCLFIK